jgi:acyl dehydratase
VPVPYGRFFEEFTLGEVMRHWPGRTITEADCTWFALLTMNQHPVHSDAHYAATRPRTSSGWCSGRWCSRSASA